MFDSQPMNKYTRQIHLNHRLFAPSTDLFANLIVYGCLSLCAIPQLLPTLTYCREHQRNETACRLHTRSMYSKSTTIVIYSMFFHHYIHVRHHKTMCDGNILHILSKWMHFFLSSVVVQIFFWRLYKSLKCKSFLARKKNAWTRGKQQDFENEYEIWITASKIHHIYCRYEMNKVK